MAAKIVEVPVLSNGGMCAIPVPFDSRAVFGKVRAPVIVTVNGYTFRSTIARMGGESFIPFRKSHREAAGVEVGARVKVRIAADMEPRVIDVPPDLVKALHVKPALWKQWNELSYTDRREHVEAVTDAKKPETRMRRIAKVVGMVSARLVSKGVSK